MAHLRKLILGTCAAALMATGVAAKNDITVAMQLEPPHLDPTSAAAGAIDQVLYDHKRLFLLFLLRFVFLF